MPETLGEVNEIKGRAQEFWIKTLAEAASKILIQDFAAGPVGKNLGSRFLPTWLIDGHDDAGGRAGRIELSVLHPANGAFRNAGRAARM